MAGFRSNQDYGRGDRRTGRDEVLGITRTFWNQGDGCRANQVAEHSATVQFFPTGHSNPMKLLCNRKLVAKPQRELLHSRIATEVNELLLAKLSLFAIGCRVIDGRPLLRECC